MLQPLATSPHMSRSWWRQWGGLHLQHQDTSRLNISQMPPGKYDGFSIIISMCFFIACDLWFLRWSCSSSFCDSPTCAGIYGETHWWAGKGSLEWESEGLCFWGGWPLEDVEDWWQKDKFNDPSWKGAIFSAFSTDSFLLESGYAGYVSLEPWASSGLEVGIGHMSILLRMLRFWTIQLWQNPTNHLTDSNWLQLCSLFIYAQHFQKLFAKLRLHRPSKSRLSVIFCFTKPHCCETLPGRRAYLHTIRGSCTHLSCYIPLYESNLLFGAPSGNVGMWKEEGGRVTLIP